MPTRKSKFSFGNGIAYIKVFFAGLHMLCWLYFYVVKMKDLWMNLLHISHDRKNNHNKSKETNKKIEIKMIYLCNVLSNPRVQNFSLKEKVRKI
jgi:hypothetical protein